MTLRCECGGSVTIQGGSDPDAESNGFFEWYECVACGRTGTLEADHTTGKTHLSGCLTETGGGYA